MNQITSLLSAGIIGTALALTGCSENNLDQSKALVKKATGGQVTILNHFETDPNLYGFVIKNKEGQEGIVYTTVDGQYFFSGQFYNQQGKNLTKSQFNTYVEPEAAKYAYDHAADTTYIQQGKDNAPHKMYIVVDPNCLYCHKLFQAVQPYIDKGKLAVRWIVVGMIKPSSQGKAYAIIGSDDPLKAMQQNESGFEQSSEQGGIKGADDPDGSTKRALAKNMQFIKKAGISGTPVMIYQTQGGIKQLQQGMPNNVGNYITLPGNAW